MTELLIASLILSWVAIGFLALLLLALARQIGILHERIAPLGALSFQWGIKVGEKSPLFELKDVDQNRPQVRIGGEHPLKKNSLLLFVSPSCPICKKLIPGVASLSRSLNNLDIIFASDGENLAAHQQYRASTFLSPFPYVLSRELGVAFGVSALPYAIYLDAEGKVMAKGLVNNLEQLEGLLHHTQQQREESKESLKLALSKKDFSRSPDFKNTNHPA